MAFQLQVVLPGNTACWVVARKGLRSRRAAAKALDIAVARGFRSRVVAYTGAPRAHRAGYAYSNGRLYAALAAKGRAA